MSVPDIFLLVSRAIWQFSIIGAYVLQRSPPPSIEKPQLHGFLVLSAVVAPYHDVTQVAGFHERLYVPPCPG